MDVLSVFNGNVRQPMTQDKLNKAVELINNKILNLSENLHRGLFYTHSVIEILEQLKSLLQSDNNTDLTEELERCDNMMQNPPTDTCKTYYEGKKHGIELALGVLRSDDVGREVVVEPNLKCTRCTHTNGNTVFVGSNQCGMCDHYQGHKPKERLEPYRSIYCSAEIWPDNQKKGEG